MKILWLTGHDIDLDNNKNSDKYNGRGWVESLLDVISETKQIELHVVLISKSKRNNCKVKNVNYYTIWNKEKSSLEKALFYYSKSYTKNDSYYFSLNSVIDNIKPDIIHLFGIENSLADVIILQNNIPVIVHLQGILAPINNAFYPVDFNKFSFIFPITFREWIFRNGFIYAKNNIEHRANLEYKKFQVLSYVMGRTEWDYQMIKLLAPKCEYYHVDEVLRPSFYKNEGTWKITNNKKFIIVSTISETIYKGLDLILKTANILKTQTDILFEWHVIGLDNSSRMIKFFEKTLNLKSNDLNVKYIGVKNEIELCECLLKASVYVHPSYIDNSPNSVCEAQMLGLPIIATNVGGVASLIEHKKSGILVPANAPFELSYYINEIKSNNVLAITLSNNGNEVSKIRHNKQNVIDNLLNCYNTVKFNFYNKHE